MISIFLFLLHISEDVWPLISINLISHSFIVLGWKMNPQNLSTNLLSPINITFYGQKDFVHVIALGSWDGEIILDYPSGP